MQFNVYTDYIAKQPVRKIYLLNQDYAWGHSVSRAVTEMLARKRPDIRIVGNDLVPLQKVKDFAPYVSKIAASGADSVLTGNKTIAHMDFLPLWQTIEMFAAAIERAGSTDPVKVAYALEGMEYNGPAGRSWMRAEDHQLMAPTYVTSLTRAGQPGVQHDNEGTGYGWKTEVLIEAKDSVPPMKCRMERPPR